MVNNDNTGRRMYAGKNKNNRLTLVDITRLRKTNERSNVLVYVSSFFYFRIATQYIDHAISLL